VILILALILVPLAAGLMLLGLPELPRKVLVSLVTLAVCCGTVALATRPTPVDLSGLSMNHHWINLGMLLVEIGMGIYVIYVGVRAAPADCGARWLRRG
jgi:hypothetical protein